MTELNANDGSWERTLYGFNEPARIAVDGTHIWVPNSGGDSVTELNASDGSGSGPCPATATASTARGRSPWTAPISGSPTKAVR